MLTLEADSYDLVYDEQRGLVWLAVMRISEPDWLYAVSANGDLDRWALPDSQHNGYLSQVEIDATGAVWVSQEYVLTRFDPQTEEITSLSLPEDAPGALPGALGPGNPLPGTWISAIAPYGDGVLVARNNVATFVAYDAALQTVTSIPIPAEYAGARDLIASTEGIVAIGGQRELDRLAIFSAGGELLRETRGIAGVPESRLSVLGPGAVMVTGSPPSIVSLVDLHPEGVPSCTGPPATVAAADRAGRTFCYDQSTATVLRDGEGVSVVAQLDMIEGEIWAPPPGDRVTVRTAPSLTDMVVDKNGTVWFFVLGPHQLRSAGG